jgi:hypothetical protein
LIADDLDLDAITAGRAGVYSWAMGGSGKYIKFNDLTIHQY